MEQPSYSTKHSSHEKLDGKIKVLVTEKNFQRIKQVNHHRILIYKNSSQKFQTVNRKDLELSLEFIKTNCVGLNAAHSITDINAKRGMNKLCFVAYRQNCREMCSYLPLEKQLTWQNNDLSQV